MSDYTELFNKKSLFSNFVIMFTAGRSLRPLRVASVVTFANVAVAAIDQQALPAHAAAPPISEKLAPELKSPNGSLLQLAGFGMRRKISSLPKWTYILQAAT